MGSSEIYIAIRNNLVTIVVINIIAIVVCRLANFAVVAIIWRFRLSLSRELNLCLQFLTDLIFTFELHVITICCVYYLSISTANVFLVTSLCLAYYYYLAWSPGYCHSQFLSTHFANLNIDFFSTFDRHKNVNFAANYLFIIVQVLCICFVMMPLSNYLMDKLLSLTLCGQYELECWICHHRFENIYLAAFIELVGAFLIAGVINKFVDLSLVTLTLLFRLLVYPLFSTFGYSPTFIHILPVTSISYMVFCWDHVHHYHYFLVHWLAPFLGSFLGWLFFHPQTPNFKSSQNWVPEESKIKTEKVKSQTLQPNISKVIPPSAKRTPFDQDFEITPKKNVPLQQVQTKSCHKCIAANFSLEELSSQSSHDHRCTNYEFTEDSTCNFKQDCTQYCTCNFEPRCSCDCTQDCTQDFTQDCTCDSSPVINFHNNNNPHSSTSSEFFDPSKRARFRPIKTDTFNKTHTSSHRYKSTGKERSKSNCGTRTRASTKSRFLRNLDKRTKCVRYN